MKGASALFAFVITLALFCSGVGAQESAASPSETKTTHTKTYPASSLIPSPGEIITLTRGAFSLTIPELTTKVIACPSGTGINVKRARWIAVTSVDKVRHEFNRTLSVSNICRGLSNCVLKPIAHLERVTDHIYHFMGIPMDDASYTLEIEGSCDSNAMIPHGRKVIASIDPQKDLVMGCREGEVINLSYVRGSGEYSSIFYRNIYCNTSFIETVYKDCQNKRNCVIKKGLYLSDEKCKYDVIDAQYYCRPPIYNGYADVTSKENAAAEYTLTAEENAPVTIKAPAGNLLTVRSVFWDVIGKQNEELDPARNRLDLIQFYCEGRSTCSFAPKRTSSGLLEMRLGGITSSPDKRFILKATIGTVPEEKKQLDMEVNTVEAKKGQKIKMTCDKGKLLRVVSAIWGGHSTGTTDNRTTIFWEEKTVDGKPYRMTEIAAYLEKLIFNKQTIEYDPFARNAISGSDRPQLPLIPTVEESNHVLTVKYTCIDVKLAPSISDLRVTTGTVEDAASQSYHLDKEYVRDFAFAEDSQMFIMLEHNDMSTVKIGDYLILEVPAKTSQSYVVTLEKETPVKHETKGESDNAIIGILIADKHRIQISTHLYRGETLVDTFIDEVVGAHEVQFTKKVKDVVVATGGVTGMRVLYRGEEGVASEQDVQ